MIFVHKFTFICTWINLKHTLEYSVFSVRSSIVKSVSLAWTTVLLPFITVLLSSPKKIQGEHFQKITNCFEPTLQIMMEHTICFLPLTKTSANSSSWLHSFTCMSSIHVTKCSWVTPGVLFESISTINRNKCPRERPCQSLFIDLICLKVDSQKERFIWNIIATWGLLEEEILCERRGVRLKIRRMTRSS